MRTFHKNELFSRWIRIGIVERKYLVGSVLIDEFITGFAYDLALDI